VTPKKPGRAPGNRSHLERVAEACREIFVERAKHSWPPRLTIEPSWPEQYRVLAVDHAFPIEDVAQAVELVEVLIDELAAFGMPLAKDKNRN
jgi:anti-sigma regulatory factor (Ser/Thr protein kinase)